MVQNNFIVMDSVFLYVKKNEEKEYLLLHIILSIYIKIILQSEQNAYSFEGSAYFATDNEIPEDILFIALTQAFSGKNLIDYQNYLNIFH